MKKILCIIIFTFILMSSIATFADDEIKVYVNGIQVQFDVPPQVINDRTFVPMRAIFEAMGMIVSWDELSQSIHAYTSDHDFIIPIGNNTIQIDNREVNIDVPAQIVDDRTLIPIRIISDNFRSLITWTDEEKTVEIFNYEITKIPLQYRTKIGDININKFDITLLVNNNRLGWNSLDIEFQGIITPIKITDMGVDIDGSVKGYFEGANATPPNGAFVSFSLTFHYYDKNGYNIGNQISSQTTLVGQKFKLTDTLRAPLTTSRIEITVP